MEFLDSHESWVTNALLRKLRLMRVVLIFVITMVISACSSSSGDEFGQRIAQTRKAVADQSNSETSLSQMRKFAMDAHPPTDGNTVTTDQIFDWAETKFSQFCPS